MNESEGRGVELATATESYTASNSRSNARRYSSPNRVLARSMRISRDNWKIKHQAVQEKLKQERQLSADRGRSRDQWKQKCETATSRAEQAEERAQQRLEELGPVRAELAKREAKKK
jgi:hypothetical protein